MVVKSYESKSTVDRLKELEKIVFKTHNPLTTQDVMRSIEEHDAKVRADEREKVLKEVIETLGNDYWNIAKIQGLRGGNDTI